MCIYQDSTVYFAVYYLQNEKTGSAKVPSEKKYEQWLSRTKPIRLSDFILKTLSYLRNAWLTGHTNNQLQMPLKSLWNAKAALLTECQAGPAQISHSTFSSCAVPQTFLTLCELRATLGAGVSTSDQSLGRSWMRKLIHFPNMAGLKTIPSLPLALGTCHTPSTLKFLIMPIILSLGGHLRCYPLRYDNTPTYLSIWGI